jgi:hypothetical protein
MYILNTEPLKSLGCPLSAVFHFLHRPMPQDVGTPSLLQLQIYTFFYFSWGVLRYFIHNWQNNSFPCLLRRLSRPQDVGHLCLCYCKCSNPFYNLNCSARELAPWRRVTEKRHFSTLNVGLAGKCIPFYILNCCAWECVFEAVVQKRVLFSTLILGPVGDWTRATSAGGSGACRSAIYYTTCPCLPPSRVCMFIPPWNTLF